jgi:hypothetical protein
MAEDHLFRIRQEIEIIVFIAVLGVTVCRCAIAIRLEITCRPVAINMVPASIDVDSIPAVIGGSGGDRITRSIVGTLGPPTDGDAVEP